MVPPLLWDTVKKISTTLRKHSRNTLLVLPIILLGLMGCAPLIRTEQASHKNEILLNRDNTIGQTFLARYDGLNGIVLFLNPDEQSDGKVVLQLKEENDDSSVLRSSSIQLESATRPDFYQFSFPIINNSASEDYYFEISFFGNGDVKVGAGPGDNYLNGSAYLDSGPISKQIALRLVYDPIIVVIGLFNEFLKWAITIALSLFLFIIPGWALMIWLLPTWKNLSLGEKSGIAAGTSLALYPLILVWSNLIGFRLGQLFLFLPFAGLLYVIWYHRNIVTKSRYYFWNTKSKFQEARIEEEKGRDFKQFIQDYLPEILLIVILGLILSVRYWNIRLVDAPLWGDSYQHSMIAQLLVNNNGLTNTWLPYVPYQSLTVHFGFPASVAIFQWLTQIPNPIATLYIGQILNVLAALSLYPLAVRMSGGNRWAGLGAVIIAGLLLPIPAFYTNWGRYSQLAGQVSLPIALWLCWEALEVNRKRQKDPLIDPTMEITNSRQEFFYRIAWREAIVAGTVIAGMTLTYYRMPFYLGTFMIAWLITWGIMIWQNVLRQWGYTIIRLILILSISLLLILPWGFNMAGSKLMGSIESGIATGSPFNTVVQDFQAWRSLDFFVSPFIILMIILATILNLIFNRRLIITLSLWFFLLVAYITGQLIGFPGANMIQNFAVIIALYIPISLLLGWLFGFTIENIYNFNSRFAQVTSIILIIFAGMWGAWNQRNIVNVGDFALVLRPDIKAMEWIRDNTPIDANFLVESFRIYNGTSGVGSDAGWWIPLLTGRKNTMPPQYALLNEVPIEPNYSQDVVDLVAMLEKKTPNSKEGLELLCEQGITHIYIGQRQGKVGAGASQLFLPKMFDENPAYELVYHHDRVYIYELDTNHCSENR